MRVRLGGACAPLPPPGPAFRARARFWRQVRVPCTGSRGAAAVSQRCPSPAPLPPPLTAAMIGQKTLHSFFSAAPPKKRGRSPEPVSDAEVASGGLKGAGCPGGDRGGWRVGGRQLCGEVSRRWWPLGRPRAARPLPKKPALLARLTDLPIEATLRRLPNGR